MQNSYGNSSPHVVHTHNLYFRSVGGWEGKEKLMFETGPPFLHEARSAKNRAGGFYARELAKLDCLDEVFLVTLNRDGSERFSETIKGRGRINTW